MDLKALSPQPLSPTSVCVRVPFGLTVFISVHLEAMYPILLCEAHVAQLNLSPHYSAQLCNRTLVWRLGLTSCASVLYVD